jgi:hypothetical protein
MADGAAPLTSFVVCPLESFANAQLRSAKCPIRTILRIKGEE